MKAILVAGLGYGDEGKGTTVDFLTRHHKAEIVVRYNGGAQAGHNVVLPDRRHHCFAQFGAGTFAGARTFLSRYMLVNPIALFAEARHLLSVGVRDPLRLVTVDLAAVLTTPFHVAANRLRELLRSNGRHGSCGMGIGETMQGILRESPATVLTVWDIVTGQDYHEKIEQIRRQKWGELEPLVKAAGTMTEAMQREWSILCDEEVGYVTEAFDDFMDQVQFDEWSKLAAQLAKDEVVIFEGAQGVLLDQEHGCPPHTTWTDLTFRNAEALLDGHDVQEIDRIGVMRSYATRHGAGPFVTEDENLSAKRDHNVPTDWQGDLRVGHLDLVSLRYALDVLETVDSISLTHLDSLARHAQVCVAYAVDGDSFAESPLPRGVSPQRGRQRADITKRARPVLRAWRDWADSPSTFVTWIERQLERPVNLLSTGPTYLDKVAR